MATKNISTDILQKIKEDIVAGKIKYGERLPTETELAKKWRVSRPTIAKVYDSLQADAWVEKKIGSGTTVIYKNKKEGLVIGLLLPGPGESEFMELIIEQISELSGTMNFSCMWEGAMVKDASLRSKQILKICQNYIDNNVSGVLFSPLERTNDKDSLNEQVCEMLTKKHIPIVLIDRDIKMYPERSAYDLIGIDNFQVGYMLAKHMIERACKEIYFLSRIDSAPTVDIRSMGCMQALNDCGFKKEKYKILKMDPENKESIKKIKINKGHTGIICANDSTAIVLIQTLKNIGLSVPAEVLVSGIDDMKYASMFQPSLTSFRQPCKDIGKVAVEQLFSRIGNPGRVPTTISLSGSLIERESTLKKKI